MKKITVDGEEYTLEYSFEAAECGDVVQKMFNIMSGAFVAKKLYENEHGSTDIAMIDGTAELMAEMPKLCAAAFYAGLIEHHKVSRDEAKKLMRGYIKENDISYPDLYKEMETCMEADGFFKLSGLEEMLNEVRKPEKPKAKAKAPADRQKKETSIK